MASTTPAKLFLLLATLPVLAQRASAEAIFQDGFEECGAGRWSAGDPSPIAEKITGLTATELANALGACAPSLMAASFRLSDGSAPDSTVLGYMSNSQSGIFDAFGTGGMLPTAGGRMIALSSGTAREPLQPSWTDPDAVGSSFHGPSTGPAVYTSAHGDGFPGGLGCPGGPNTTNDSIGLRLTLEVPESATRLVFDWRYLVADWPEWVCTNFVDNFLAIVITGSSEELPADRNVAIDSAGYPINVNTSYMVDCNGCSGGTGALAGTGYPVNDSAATEWHTAAVPVVGGETLVLDLMTFDVGDHAWDNLVLLDGLRWLAD
jgi:hypothetical protein